jgi:hypothetical protein
MGYTIYGSDSRYLEPDPEVMKKILESEPTIPRDAHNHAQVFIILYKEYGNEKMTFTELDDLLHEQKGVENGQNLRRGIRAWLKRMEIDYAKSDVKDFIRACRLALSEIGMLSADYRTLLVE